MSARPIPKITLCGMVGLKRSAGLTSQASLYFVSLDLGGPRRWSRAPAPRLETSIAL